jgi:hypothetical protein
MLRSYPGDPEQRSRAQEAAESRRARQEREAQDREFYRTHVLAFHNGPDELCGVNYTSKVWKHRRAWSVEPGVDGLPRAVEIAVSQMLDEMADTDPDCCLRSNVVLTNADRIVAVIKYDPTEPIVVRF